MAKREPMLDNKGNIIDDGINREMLLCSSENEALVDFFLTSIKERIHGRSWKIWKV